MSRTSKLATPGVARVGKGAQTKRCLSAEEVKTRLHEQGTTLKEWSRRHGFCYDTVSTVVRGINRATYGQGHRIAVALGMKVS